MISRCGSIVLVAALLSTGQAAASSSGPTDSAGADTAAAELTHAIAFAKQGKDSQATLLLMRLLGQTPPAPIAAKAHMYLAIMAFNRLHSDEARHEFQLALWADPAIELPPNSSPKAELAFAEARTQLAQSLVHSGLSDLSTTATPPPTPAQLATAPPAQPASAVPPEALSTTGAAPPPSQSHTLAYVLGGAALVALGFGIYGEVVVANYSSAISNANKNPGKYTSAEVTSQSNGAPGWQYASIVCFGAAALGAGGALLTW